MIWEKHLDLTGKHALFSPSKPSWLNKDSEMLREYISNSFAAARGTELHAWRADRIRLRRKQPRNSDEINMFINDAIGYGMESEQILYYSPYVFGTADSIMFNERKSLLRVHDLKTGRTPAKMEQLIIYAALFCLNYGVNPSDIETVLRIYQNGEIAELTADKDDILPVMEQIKICDEIAADISKDNG